MDYSQIEEIKLETQPNIKRGHVGDIIIVGEAQLNFDLSKLKKILPLLFARAWNGWHPLSQHWNVFLISKIELLSTCRGLAISSSSQHEIDKIMRIYIELLHHLNQCIGLKKDNI